MIKKILVLATVVMLAITGCTQNTVARQFGGELTIDLPENTKLLEVTWKDSDVWYLTRPMRDGEEAETYHFNESSELGLWDGTVIIIEHKGR